MHETNILSLDLNPQNSTDEKFYVGFILFVCMLVFYLPIVFCQGRRALLNGSQSPEVYYLRTFQ